MITPGDVDDRKHFEYKAFVKFIHGKLVGDKGYIGRNLFERLFVDGIQIITKLKSNMKGVMMSLSDKLLLRKLAIIEIGNDELKNIAQVEQVRFPMTLDEIATMLHPQKFFRANRQYIISRKAVVSVSNWFGGRLNVQLNPPATEKVLISKARVTAFKDWF